MSTIRSVSPIDGSVYVERPCATGAEIEAATRAARAAQPDWAARPIAERARLCSAFVDAMLEHGDAIAVELARQMGRPVRYGGGELGGFEERARHMIGIAADALADVEPNEKAGFRRFVRRVPLGTVLTVAPWNFPFLTAVNSVVPALMAGNAVLLKHASPTLRVGERFAEAFAEAGLPDGVFHHLVMNHARTAELIGSGDVDMVCFTGSVGAGREIEQAALAATAGAAAQGTRDSDGSGDGAGGGTSSRGEGKFIPVGLELGGKDPAYVRADADLAHAIENVADGAFFNSGQSCCGIERVYAHESVFDALVDGIAGAARALVLGDPLDPETTLGPLIRPAAADFVRQQIDDAVAAGATAHVAPAAFPRDAPGSAYLAPQVLSGVDHRMSVMTDESFGPVVGVMKVSDDDEAVALMNDSPFGLTAAIWTADAEAAIALGERLETGTVFMNRCDYLDPALAWTGVKASGRGVTLSPLGYEALTRPKSFHLRTETR